MRPIVWKSSSKARSSGRRWPRSFPAATSACSIACREAPVEYWVSIWMSVTSTPFRLNYLRVTGMPCRWPERAGFAGFRTLRTAGDVSSLAHGVVGRHGMGAAVDECEQVGAERVMVAGVQAVPDARVDGEAAPPMVSAHT